MGCVAETDINRPGIPANEAVAEVNPFAERTELTKVIYTEEERSVNISWARRG